MSIIGKPAWAMGLVEALEEDPFYAAITVDFEDNMARRRDVLCAYFELSMVEGLKIGRGLVLPDSLGMPGPASDAGLGRGADGPGAAIWVLPAPVESVAAARIVKAAALAAVLGVRGLENYYRVVDFMSPRGEQVMGSSAWYLSILGIAPSAQGRGLGSRLLAPTLIEADQAGAVCFAETFSPRNLPFYERLGFAVSASYVEPLTAAEYWVVVRQPR